MATTTATHSPPASAIPASPPLTREAPDAAEVEDAVRSWASDPARPPGFPYRPLLDLTRRTGRNQLPLGLQAALRSARTALPVGSGGAEADPEQLLLRAWLPMASDVGEGDYDSYVGAAVLATLHEQHRSWSRSEVLDTTLVALLADLVVGECAQLDDTEPDRERQRRLRAVGAALAGSAHLAPRARNAPPGWLGGGRTCAAEAIEDVVHRAQGLAAAVRRGTDPATTTAVRCSFLPTTTVPDELMFIRTIQLFECLYQQVERGLDAAIEAAAGHRPEAAAAELAGATSRMSASPLLYRIVTTMPREAFAVIRDATHGRSALQSRAFRRVEQLCAHPCLTAGHPVVRAGVVELDQVWTAMKRTHWGIALKIIGRVPGTGGTSGADFLRERADRSLLPEGAAA